MKTIDETEDCEVGYGRPPKSGQFKKGISGNPSGRPKKPSDLYSEITRELNGRVVINENGKRKVIKMSEASTKQLVTKAVSGNFREQRLLASLRKEMAAKAAEQQLKSQNQRDIESLSARELTDEELWILIGRNLPPHILEDSSNRPMLGAGEVDNKELLDRWKVKRSHGDQ